MHEALRFTVSDRAGGWRHSDPGSPRSARAELVSAQYEAVDAAEGYAAAYEGWGPNARYFHSRLHAVSEALGRTGGGTLLDVGCGPGMFVLQLLHTRGDDFHITALDRSPVMADAVRAATGDDPRVRTEVGQAERMPFPDSSFDVVVAMGVLEYSVANQALSEIARVARPGATVLVTMLNPLSPYRIVEWCLFWPLLRALGTIEGWLGWSADRRHGVRRSGIRAYSPRRLRRMLAEAGLRPVDTVAYDVTPLVPPVDRVVRRWTRSWRDQPERTVSRGFRRWLGTAYLVVAHRHDSRRC